jgi:uncharacterized protein (DUF3820 family)
MAEMSLWLIPFGKYRGPIEDVPTHYLNWLMEQEWFCKKFRDGVPKIEEELKFRERFGEE